VKLKDKVVVVTGAGRGIGESIARRLSAEGASGVINDIDLPAAQSVAESLIKSGQPSMAIKADISIKNDVTALFEKVLRQFGRVDILVNNAGISVVSPSVELEEKAWRRGIDVMLTGVFFCSQAAAKEMIKQQYGKIINIASMFGIGGVPERACYCSAKAAVIELTKVLGCEWAHYNINVNAVAPGYVETDLVKNLISGGTFDVETLNKRTPLGRLAKVNEIADIVVFLAVDESKYIEGQTIVIDGGWSSYMYLDSWLQKNRCQFPT
jgi:NAD(P)-dependent dehydrogenase (short-subunit alcohol dehydrogenase family)